MKNYIVTVEIDKVITNKLVKAETAEEAERKVKEKEKMNDFKKIRDVLKGLSCEELIDVYNSVLKALGAKEQEYIYENSDEALDRVFKDWTPSEIMHYLDDRDWLNADYFAYDDALWLADTG